MFNIHKSFFLLQSVCLCFVWFSQQTSIIFLYDIKLLAFINKFLCLPFITINHAAYILTKDTNTFA